MREITDDATRDDDDFCSCGDDCARDGTCTPMRINFIEKDDFTKNGPDTWLWCLYCSRFFQERHVRVDYLGNRQGCAHCNCAGYGVAVFPWRSFHKKGWPEHERDLRFGMRAS